MKNINDILDIINQLDYDGNLEHRLILIVNNDDIELLDPVCNYIYRKYNGNKNKVNISSNKGLYKKICDIKNKFIKINIDISKIQFSSTHSRKYSEFSEIKIKSQENNSIFLFKYEKCKNLYTNKMWQYRWTSYFDLILTIEDKKLKIINSNKEEFDINQIIRSTKLRKLKKKFTF